MLGHTSIGLTHRYKSEKDGFDHNYDNLLADCSFSHLKRDFEAKALLLMVLYLESCEQKFYIYLIFEKMFLAKKFLKFKFSLVSCIKM